MYVENSEPVRHCSGVIAFWKDGYIHIKCRHCKKWVKLSLDTGKTEEHHCNEENTRLTKQGGFNAQRYKSIPKN